MLDSPPAFIASTPSATYTDLALERPKRLLPSGRGGTKMSLTKEVISEINRLNASKSTGPESQLGKQRSRQESEVEAFGAPPDAYRILSYLPPPKGAQTLPQPANPADPCTPGDLVTGASTQNSEENMAA